MEAFHILIVEDDKEIREGVEIYLKNQGYQVSQAADGVEGLARIEEEEIHLAIDRRSYKPCLYSDSRPPLRDICGNAADGN